MNVSARTGDQTTTMLLGEPTGREPDSPLPSTGSTHADDDDSPTGLSPRRTARWGCYWPATVRAQRCAASPPQLGAHFRAHGCRRGGHVGRSGHRTVIRLPDQRTRPQPGAHGGPTACRCPTGRVRWPPPRLERRRSEGVSAPRTRRATKMPPGRECQSADRRRGGPPRGSNIVICRLTGFRRG